MHINIKTRERAKAPEDNLKEITSNMNSNLFSFFLTIVQEKNSFFRFSTLICSY